MQEIDSVRSSRCDRTQLVLQYSGYGFDPTGAPAWLVEALREVTAKDPNARLITVFHELFASVPPWKRAFWYTALQKAAARETLLMSTAALCTIERNQRILRAWNNRIAVDVLAIPSGVGEPGEVPAIEARRRRMMVFGGQGLRSRAYVLHAKQLASAVEALGIDEIIDIGPGQTSARVVGPAPVRAMGVLDPGEISRQMLNCRAGFVSYYPGYLGKSSVFAAYCAHGVMPVAAIDAKSENDGLAALTHYWLPSHGTQTVPVSQMAGVARNASSWYRGHDVNMHAEWVARRVMMP
jgi:hypothetical protein